VVDVLEQKALKAYEIPGKNMIPVVIHASKKNQILSAPWRISLTEPTTDREVGVNYLRYT